MAKTKHAGGRPPKFTKSLDLQTKANTYFELCEENKQLPEKAGLCLALRISRDTYSEYRKKPEFADTIKGIDLYIESAWVRRLNSNAPTGAIFYLKNAFKEEYRDRYENDLTSGGDKLQTIVYLPAKNS